MQELNSFIFARDLSRFLNLSSSPVVLKPEMIESLCKTTFFREEKIEIFEGKALVHYKCRIIKK